MIYIKWAVLLYIFIFQIFFGYISLKTKKKIGLPIKTKSGGVKIAVMLGGAIFTIALISLFFPDFFYSMFIPITFLKSNLTTILGSFLLIFSLIIGITSARELGNSWRVGILENQKTKLIQTGIYQFCRNPYFLAYYTMFLALFFVVPSVVLLILVMANIFCFHQMIKKEEKYLEKVHGNKYLDYCKTVGRYLPKF